MPTEVNNEVNEVVASIDAIDAPVDGGGVSYVVGEKDFGWLKTHNFTSKTASVFGRDVGRKLWDTAERAKAMIDPGASRTTRIDFSPRRKAVFRGLYVKKDQ